MHPAPRATIAVLTYNRREQVLETLRALVSLPGDWPIVVVDNGSADGTPAAIAQCFPSVMAITLHKNIGAAARNVAVAQARTPYVAFCDDDTQWEPQALAQAIRMLDASPTVAVVSACVQVGKDRAPDPACVDMAQSPLSPEGLPGPQLLGFMAGACIMRVQAFNEVGGYWAPFFIGGEEELMALDLAEKGWRMVYAKSVVTRHFPSTLRDASLRQKLLLRNAIWVAWMRRPWLVALRVTASQLRRAYAHRILGPVLIGTALGLPRAVIHRKTLSSRVEDMRAQLDRQPRR